jgi:hypothetical protein
MATIPDPQDADRIAHRRALVREPLLHPWLRAALGWRLDHLRCLWLEWREGLPELEEREAREWREWQESLR